MHIKSNKLVNMVRNITYNSYMNNTVNKSWSLYHNLILHVEQLKIHFSFHYIWKITYFSHIHLYIKSMEGLYC